MKRREFHILFQSLFAGAAATSAFPDAAHAIDRRRVVVIGAGLAGLSAAQQLRAQGRDVLVLEGRNRIGGRIWTSMKWQDMPLDLGASWIHGTEGNPLTELADEIEAKRIETSYEHSILYGTDGKVLDEPDAQDLNRLRQQLESALRKAQNADRDVSVREVARQLARRIEADDETSRWLDFLVSGTIEQEYAGSGENLSAHWYDSAKSVDGEDVVFADGFRVIIELLAKGLRIETKQVVQQIDWAQSPVRIITTTGQEYVAEQVLVTLPLGVLQAGDVTFTPGLPADKQTAITRLGMGVLNKCYLKFEKSFWPDDVDWLEYIPETHGHWTEWVSFTRAAGIPVLLGFNAADRGRAIEALSDQQIVASAMESLRRMFGETIPDPVDSQLTRWASDRFSRGSYSFNALGSTPNMRRALAQPLQGRLYFAGEATGVEMFGTAHAAVLSGRRAATEIAQE